MDLTLPAAVASITLVSGFTAGYEWRDRYADLELSELKAEYLAAQVEANEFAENAEMAMQAVSDNAARLYADLQAERERKNKVITKEVVKYAENPNAGRCVLPADWVRTHDQAASGMPDDSEPSSGSNDDPARFTDVDALATVTENYRICVTELDKLKALQSWVNAIIEAGK